MEKVDTTSRIFCIYMLVLLLMLLGGMTFGQIQVAQFNAEWNKANEVTWINKLADCETISYVDINTQKEMQKVLDFIYDKSSYSDQKYTDSLCEQIIDIAIDTLIEELQEKEKEMLDKKEASKPGFVGPKLEIPKDK